MLNVAFTAIKVMQFCFWLINQMETGLVHDVLSTYEVPRQTVTLYLGDLKHLKLTGGVYI